MNKLINRIIFVCIIIYFIRYDAICYCNDSEWREKFLSSYRSAYNNLVLHYTDIEYKYVATFYMGKITQQSSCEGKFNLNLYITRQSAQHINTDSGSVISKFRPMIVCSNSKYSFELVDFGNESSQYVIRDLKILKPSQHYDYFAFTAPIADTIVGETYLKISEDTRNEFLFFGDAVYHGKNAMCIVLNIIYNDIITRQSHKDKVTYYFMPDRGWICIGWIHETNNINISEYIEYDRDEQYPPLKSIKRWVHDLNKSEQPQLQWRMDFSKFSRIAPLKESEFTLSTFGFPEPQGINWSHSRRWYLWISIAGLLCVIAGVALYALRHRLATRRT